MKLSDQVCTLEQAKKLRVLGIDAPAYFLQGDNTNPVEAGLMEEYKNMCYKVYTSAELGMILPDLIETTDKQYEIVHLRDDDDHVTMYVRGNSLLNWLEKTAGRTEAETRAEMLIRVVEKKYMTVEELNFCVNP